jgi:hypothetical protein
MLDSVLLISYSATPPVFIPTYVNRWYGEYFSAMPGQLADSCHFDSATARNPESVRTLLARCIATDLPVTSVELPRKPQNGTKVINWVHVPVKDEQGAVTEVMSIGVPQRS